MSDSPFSPKWTTEQQQVIDARPQNLLVSAGAGAGKTATLIERIYRLITEPPEDNPNAMPSSIESMAVLTFTKAAAAQMRDRLARRLRSELEKSDDLNLDLDRDRHLESQLALLPRADISTLHSFCFKLLREYGHLIELPPDFDIMAQEEATLLHRQLLSDYIEELLADDSRLPTIRVLLGNLKPTSGFDSLEGLLPSLHSFLDSLPNPEEFLNKAFEPYRECADENLRTSECQIFSGFLEKLKSDLSKVESLLSDCITRVSFDGLSQQKKSFTKYWKTAQQTLETVQAALDSLGDDEQELDLAKLIKLESTPQERFCDTEDDFLLRDFAVQLKQAKDEFNKSYKDFGEGLTLGHLRVHEAQQLPLAELIFDVLGLQFNQRLSEKHRQLNRYTFNQLERMTLELLQNHPAASEAIQRRYDHVFVDEFQDNSALQSVVLKSICRAAVSEKERGNFFVVGDIKQSIYGFRLADPKQFLALDKNYHDYLDHGFTPPGSIIRLLQNFRSTPQLLYTINPIFERLFSERIGSIDYDERHAFVAGKVTEDRDDPAVEIHFLEMDQESTPDYQDEDSDSEWDEDASRGEARTVARLIKNQKQAYKDTAVLVRSAKGYATVLVDAFREFGIPYTTQESIGFLSMQEVNDVLSLLTVINNPLHEVELIGMLRGPAAKWSEDELLQLRLVNRGNSLFQNLQTIAEQTDHLLHEKAKRICESLNRWQEFSSTESMGDLMNRLYRELDLEEKYSALPNGDQRLQNLGYLRDRAIQFDHFQRRGIRHFLQFIDQLMDENSELGSPPTVPQDTDAVRLMTFHKSKGLEFPVVYLPFLGKKHNEMDLRNAVLWNSEVGVGLNYSPTPELEESMPSLSHLAVKQRKKEELYSEELRLLYVAMTRAEEKVVMSGTDKKMLDKISDKEKWNKTDPADLEKLVGDGKNFLTWAMIGLGHSDAFQRLSEEEPLTRDSTLSLQCSYEKLSPNIERESENEEHVQSGAERLGIELGDWKQATKRVSDWMQRNQPVFWRAKISSTEAKRAFESVHHEQHPNAEFSSPKHDQEEWWPKSFLDEKVEQMKSTGAQRGTVVHRFMSLVNLAAMSQGDSAEQELQRLVQEEYLSKEEAKLINLDQVTEFFEGEFGQLLLKYPEYVERELAFTVAFEPNDLGASADVGKDERLLLQGIVDVFLNVPAEIPNAPPPMILDFKTDFWQGTVAHFQELTQRYTPQILLYRLGLERSLGVKIPDNVLYFFEADQGYSIPDSLSKAEILANLRTAFLSGFQDISKPLA